MPITAYIQVIGFSIILISQSFLLISLENVSFSRHLLLVIGIVLILTVIVVQMLLNTGIPKEIEITENGIKTNKLEFPINEIEKIIIQGYFIQSIGIKQIGKRFVSTKLHFRFKNDSELQIREWEQWAEENGIKVVKGTIYKWI